MVSCKICFTHRQEGTYRSVARSILYSRQVANRVHRGSIDGLFRT
jgi:hypothetical protein